MSTVANIQPKTNIQMAFHGGFSVSDDASDTIPILTTSQVKIKLISSFNLSFK